MQRQKEENTGKRRIYISRADLRDRYHGYSYGDRSTFLQSPSGAFCKAGAAISNARSNYVQGKVTAGNAGCRYSDGKGNRKL